ncbi:unnamed protein product [Symbiodinium sp. CCMP2592]|nr:unnamed protein product [Symbiodinium sp. CCMP2592]
MAPLSPGRFLCWLAWLLRAARPLSGHEAGPAKPWHPLNRRQRQERTRFFNHAWSDPSPVETAPWLGLWRPGEARMRHRRHRRLFPRRPLKPSLCGTWRGWPNRGRRIGEASNPGPVALAPPLAASGPDDANAMTLTAWTWKLPKGLLRPAHVSTAQCLLARAMILGAHIDAHLAGSLQGDVPEAWLQGRSRQRCMVCGLSVSIQHGVHPSCRPAARAAMASPVEALHGDGIQLPSFQDIIAGCTPTLRHVPGRARHLWARALTRALAAVVHRNDETSWRELLMLPQSVLDPPRRGGKQHAKAAAVYTLDRLKRWEDGERLLLWQTRQQPQRGRRRPLSKTQRQDLATSLAREGFEGKACAALLSTGLAPEDPETTAAIRALHPVHASPAVPAMHQLPPAPELVPDVVAKALRSFNAASAPSGLRVQHLRDACAPGSSAALLEQLTAVLNLLAQGQACPTAAATLAGAGLVAIPKPHGGVRPIAIGEVLRRLTGKCLMHHVRNAAREHFFPAQLGVAVPAGAEVAVHSVRAWMDRHAAGRKILLKLDFENAFNCIKREAVFAAARDHFPALSRWAILLDRYFLRLPSSPWCWNSEPAVAAALVQTQRRAAALGLRLNLKKCEVVATGDVAAGDLVGHLPDALLRRADGSSRLLRNFELLGAPIGDLASTAAHISSRVAGARTLLDAVGELEDPQVGLRLLRACAGHCRLVHSMRCAPPQAQADAFQEFDRLVQACFASLTGLHLDAAQWEQAGLNFAQAGLGLRSTALDAPAAYLASVGGSAQLCSRVDAEFCLGAVPGRVDVQQALADLNQHAAGPLTASTALMLKQKALTAGLDEFRWQRRLANCHLAAQAVLRSEAEPGARAFLAATPHGRRRMEPAAFVAELRQRLCMPDATQDEWCPRCDCILDKFSYHAGLCSAGGERTLRHNALRDLLCTWVGRAGLHPEREKPQVLLPQRPEDHGLDRRRPADIFVPSYLGAPVAFDLAVTGPQRLETLAEASRKSLAAATAYVAVKKAHLDTAATCQAQGVRFLPLVAETTGAWEAEAAKVLTQISRAAAAREGADPAALHGELLQELCVVARSFRARAVLHRRAELAAASAPGAAQSAAACLLATDS